MRWSKRVGQTSRGKTEDELSGVEYGKARDEVRRREETSGSEREWEKKRRRYGRREGTSEYGATRDTR